MTAPVIEETGPADIPVEVVDDTGDELAVRFPVLVVEGLETSDRRTISPGSLTARALPLSLLVQSEASHGGDEPGPSLVAGRIDSLERLPGPEVTSPTTGEPFPDGVFVWTGSGVIDKTAVDRGGRNVADMVERGYLRGVSVDLVGLDYEIVGEEEGTPQIITHRADLAAATLVPIPAFGDAYVELDNGQPAPEVEGLVASAVPSWRSVEVGDLVVLPAALTASADVPDSVHIPPDGIDQLVQVIDSGEQRDAVELATTILQHIAQNWAGSGEEPPAAEPDGPVADAVTASGDGPQTGGMIALVPANPERLAVEGGEPVDQLHLTVVYLGDDVTAWSAEQRAEIIDHAASAAAVFAAPIEAEVMGHAAFNPGDFNDREPCAVYLVSGQDLPGLRAEFEAFNGSEFPTYIPHVTGRYGVGPEALSYVGPIQFSALRVALADDVHDFPLGQPAQDGPQPEPEETAEFADISTAEREKAAEQGAAMDDGSYPIRDRAELEDAIQAVGRAKDVEATRRHIIKRARALDLEELIPAHWNADGTVKGKSSMADGEQIDWTPLDGSEPAEPEGTGIPDEPQQCSLCGEPATHSLLFDGGSRFAPVCQDHDQEARDIIASESFEVEKEIPILGDDEYAALVAAGIRRVRTPEGSRRYGLPIGAPITGKPKVKTNASAGLMRPITDDDRRILREKAKYAVPPAWTDVQVADNLEEAIDQPTLLVRGRDTKGRDQRVYSASFRAQQDAAKFERINQLDDRIDAIDSALARDSATNDAAAALVLIRAHGLRPGSDTDTGADKEAFGATNLRAEHVVEEPDGSIRLQFTGKKGVAIDLPITDEEAQQVLRDRVAGRSGSDRVFDTDERKVRAYLATIAPGAKPKDFRTYHGTATAEHAIEAMPAPTTQKEFQAARKRVGELVSAQLGNTPSVALASYIDPAVFKPWQDSIS